MAYAIIRVRDENRGTIVRVFDTLSQAAEAFVAYVQSAPRDYTICEADSAMQPGQWIRYREDGCEHESCLLPCGNGSYCLLCGETLS